ncbi:hypothetical protein [Candidatus Synchoanobacter obligatus]|uniref:Uncharacterized protein n=1 Tax=Candidatus Synchoanobacter obligatus TaxID=2919597 RepID=A0ABT1L526_9GAMM|nr:hypothetical protein [Candidatus Synchoanobacter obligatus]MCP8352056.1 hypothetical protein [Candidatus Synchoanobacter obligatus]
MYKKLYVTLIASLSFAHSNQTQIALRSGISLNEVQIKAADMGNSIATHYPYVQGMLILDISKELSSNFSILASTSYAASNVTKPVIDNSISGLYHVSENSAIGISTHITHNINELHQYGDTAGNYHYMSFGTLIQNNITENFSSHVEVTYDVTPESYRAFAPTNENNAILSGALKNIVENHLRLNISFGYNLSSLMD